MAFKKNIISILITAIFLTACVTTPPSKDYMQQAVSEAADVAASQGAEYAVGQLEKLAKRDPTSALPWTQIAKIRFEEEKYGQAIVAADEALQRDPDDFAAKSIWVIGGLRLARKGLLDLKGNAQLAGDARTDARELAKAMRIVLGSPAPRPAVTTTTKPENPNPGPAPNSDPGTSGDPFRFFK